MRRAWLVLLLALPAAAAPLPAPTTLPGPLVSVGGGRRTVDIRKAFFDLDERRSKPQIIAAVVEAIEAGITNPNTEVNPIIEKHLAGNSEHTKVKMRKLLATAVQAGAVSPWAKKTHFMEE